MWKTKKRKHFPKKVSYVEFHGESLFFFGESLHSRNDDGLKMAMK